MSLRARCAIAATQAKPASAGWENPNFVLVHGGGLCLCSSELYSPKTFQTSSKGEGYLKGCTHRARKWRSGFATAYKINFKKISLTTA
jgi:hypothetical protein